MHESSANLKVIFNRGGISSRFRIINIIHFAVFSALVSFAMLFVLKNITDTVSRDYAKLHSSNAAATLNSYFASEIALVQKAATSNAVIEWFCDEYNQEKKAAAYEEMMGVISILPSKSLYIGIGKTLNELSVEANFSVDDIRPYATLDPDYYDDEWYFECVSSPYDYLLNVDIDKIMHRKQVWLNYKVMRGNEVVGTLCTVLEFSEVVENIFSEYSDTKVRGLVIDEKGFVHMDSASLGDEDFLYYSVNNDRHIKSDINDVRLLSSIDDYLSGIDKIFKISDAPVVIDDLGGEYRYATIAPIASTLWSVVTIYYTSPLINTEAVIPLFVIVVAMLAIYIYVTDRLNTRLIFRPLEEITQSISRIHLSKSAKIYGVGRRDEIGDIANAVQNMKETLIDAVDKAQYDVLTGVYNRRYLEENLNRIIKALSRTGSTLSVMMVDVDLFKNYNDTYGHAMGDACLIEVTKALSSGITRRDDFIARYGGEEFVVVLPNADEEGARAMAARFLRNVNACGLPHKSSNISDCVTISIGVTTSVARHEQDAKDYIMRADEALYLSKNNGKNMFTYLEL